MLRMKSREAFEENYLRCRTSAVSAIGKGVNAVGNVMSLGLLGKAEDAVGSGGALDPAPPAPTPPPTTASPTDPTTSAAMTAAEDEEDSVRGQAANILTGGSSILNPSNVSRSVLLGS